MSDADPVLFESPEATAVAAAAELIKFGADPHVARGKVAYHKPTADKVRTAIANAEAWLADLAEGKRRNRLDNPVGFVLAQIARPGPLKLDPRALARHRRAAKPQDRSKERDQAKELDAAWEALDTAQRERLKTQVLDTLRKTDPREADYYAKQRAQDEPIRTMIAQKALRAGTRE